MRIIHLSDIHYTEECFEKYLDFYDVLSNDINTNFPEDNQTIIVVTGDLVDSSCKHPLEKRLESSYDLLKSFASSVYVSEDNIYITPGNHDLNSKVYLSDEFFRFGLDTKLTNNMFDIMLNNGDDFCNEHMQNLSVYYDFLKKTYIENKTKTFLTPLISNFTINNDSFKKINLVSLNNTWRYRRYKENENPYGDMLFSLPQLEKAKKTTLKNNFNIAIAHYPFSFINEIEKSSAEKIIMSNFDLFLCGHAHSSNNCFMSGPGDRINAGCVFNYGGNLNIGNRFDDKNHYKISYDIIDILSNSLSIHHRLFNYVEETFVPNTQLGNSGVSRYDLKSFEEHKLIDFREMLYEQLTEFDKKILSNTITTNAPKTIHNMFIEPKLREIDDKSKKQISEYYSIEKIINERLNVVIFSKKESGKSMLLYGIFDLILKNSLYHGRYPMYIDYNEYKKNHSFSKELWNNYKIGREKGLTDFVSEIDVTLLIDNLDLNDLNFIKEMADFIKTCPKLHLICTTGTSVSGNIPISFFKSEINNFIRLEMLPFNFSQINEYSEKWFNGLTDQHSREIDAVIKVIQTKKISSYPLYIGMFFWLIEEKKSIHRLDQNMVIENFVEKLLEKTKLSINTKDAFDFRNRLELLGIIASNLVTNGSEGLINDTTLTNIVSNFLDTKRWNKLFRVNDIIEYLEHTNILTREGENGTMIRFRHHSVLHYFIAINMENSDEFKEYILSRDRILNFIEVIDIYTSRNRKCKDIFDLSYSMIAPYKDLFSGRQIDLITIDKVFEKKESIIPLISSDDMDTKREEVKKIEKIAHIDNELNLIEAKNEILVNYSDMKLGMAESFERSVVLFSILIKNNEDITDIEIKSDAINCLIDSSIYFGFLYDYILNKNFIESESDELFPLIIVSSLFTPLIIQSFLNEFMGTIKIYEYLEKLMNEYNNNMHDKSLIKEYILNFLLYDNTPSHFITSKIDLIDVYSKKNADVFIEDNIFTKLRIILEGEISTDEYQKINNIILRFKQKHKRIDKKIKIENYHKSDERMKVLQKKYKKSK